MENVWPRRKNILTHFHICVLQWFHFVPKKKKIQDVDSWHMKRPELAFGGLNWYADKFIRGKAAKIGINM